MAVKETVEILKEHNLRNTEIRRQVLSIFLEAPDTALSSQDIEERFDKIDRVTLYRILRSFEDSGIIHQAIDGSSKTKYAYCSDDCTTHHHHDEHAHFHCTVCDTTTCMEMVNIPQVIIPNEYQLRDAQLILTGVCKKCNKK